MQRYLIESPHSGEECLRVLDWILAQGSQLLSKYEFSCSDTDHIGYVMIDALSKEDARRAVPPASRARRALWNCSGSRLTTYAPST